jgi:lipoprotein-anchoring transpeptidase ErfK/SrfK
VVAAALLAACGDPADLPSERVVAAPSTTGPSTTASDSTPAPTSAALTVAATSTVPTTTATTTTIATPVAPEVTTPPTTAGDPPEGVPRPSSFAPVVVATATGPVAAFSSPKVFDPGQAEWSFGAVTQFGSPTTFQVIEDRGEWIRVILPVRQNGTRAWLHTSQVSLSQHNTRIVVDLGARRVVVWDGTSVVVDTAAVIGKGSTPTPTGEFYITDVIDTQNPGGAYGPYVLATSGRSDAFDFFNGGEPLVGLHGTNAPELLGSAASNGCVRMPNSVATMLAFRTPLGAAVEIY